MLASDPLMLLSPRHTPLWLVLAILWESIHQKELAYNTFLLWTEAITPFQVVVVTNSLPGDAVRKWELGSHNFQTPREDRNQIISSKLDLNPETRLLHKQYSHYWHHVPWLLASIAFLL